MSAIGQKVRRFLSTRGKGDDDLFFLDLGGRFLQVCCNGWDEVPKFPGKPTELKLPSFAAGQEIVRLRKYDYPENGTVISFENGAALQLYYPQLMPGAEVYTDFDFFDHQQVVSHLEPYLAELEDPIVREEPAPEGLEPASEGGPLPVTRCS